MLKLGPGACLGRPAEQNRSSYRKANMPSFKKTRGYLEFLSGGPPRHSNHFFNGVLLEESNARPPASLSFLEVQMPPEQLWKVSMSSEYHRTSAKHERKGRSWATWSKVWGKFVCFPGKNYYKLDVCESSIFRLFSPFYRI